MATNILKRELKAGLKAFIFWTLGLFVMMFLGLVKYTGVGTAGDLMKDFISSFPKIVLAVMGMGGLDITSFPGFYAVLAQFAVVLTAIYAVHLGNSAVSKEFVDKTYEFIFTKPKKRAEILFPKLLAGGIYLFVYCILFFVFAFSSAAKLGLGEGMTGIFAKTALSAFLVGLIFFGLGALYASFVHFSETGAKLGNFSVLVAYLISVVYDILENNSLVRFIAPMRYFPPSELAEGEFELMFVLLAAVISAATLVGAFYFFEKKDLQAL
jgi:ABC-2 type transport system permease protein